MGNETCGSPISTVSICRQLFILGCISCGQLHFFLLSFFLLWGWRGKTISFLPHQIFTVTVVFARQGLLPILNLWSDKKAGGSVGLKSALKQHGYDLGLPCLGLSHVFTSKVHLLAALLPPGRASSITRLLLIAWRWQLTQEEQQ